MSPSKPIYTLPYRKSVVMQSPISQAACIDTFTTMKGLDVYVRTFNTLKNLSTCLIGFTIHLTPCSSTATSIA